MSIVASPRSSRRRLTLGALAGLTILLGGCGVGTRGALVPEASTGAADVDAVIATFLLGDHAVFTAEYTVTVPMTGLTTTAIVTQDDEGRRGVTIGDTRYLFVARGGGRTCDVPAARCDSGFDAAATSDTMLGPTWASVGVRARLRTDLRAAAEVPNVSTDTIAGHPVRCVDIPLQPAGTADTVWSQYCVLDSGVVARMARVDVVVELTGYRPEVDDTALSAPTTTRAPQPADDGDDVDADDAGNGATADAPATLPPSAPQ